MTEQQTPQPKKQDELLKVLQQLAPFIWYTLLFMLLLIPYNLERYKWFSTAMILGHFSALLNKIKNK